MPFKVMWESLVNNYCYFEIRNNNQAILLDENTKEIFNFSNFRSIYPRYEYGYFYCIVSNFEDKTGIIDGNGKIIVPCIYEGYIGSDKQNNCFLYIKGNDDNGDPIFEKTDIKLSEVTTTKNLLDTSETKTLSTNTQSQDIFLNDMLGKHYKILAYVLSEENVLPIEGDLSISEAGIVIVWGDGNGHADEFHVYEIGQKIKKNLWTISKLDDPKFKGKKGYVEIFAQDTDTLLIIVADSEDNHNMYLIDKHAYNKPTLTGKAK